MILNEKQLRNFWSKVDKTPGFGPWKDCWEWIAAKHKIGYGQFRVNEKMEQAHRVSYKISNPNGPRSIRSPKNIK